MKSNFLGSSPFLMNIKKKELKKKNKIDVLSVLFKWSKSRLFPKRKLNFRVNKNENHVLYINYDTFKRDELIETLLKVTEY